MQGSHPMPTQLFTVMGSALNFSPLQFNAGKKALTTVHTKGMRLESAIKKRRVKHETYSRVFLPTP